MKKVILSYLLFQFAVSTALSQIEMQNEGLTDLTAGILYAHVESRIRILGVKSKGDVSLVTSNPANISISQLEKNVFEVISKKVGIDTLRVMLNGKMIFKKSYETKILNDPKASFGDIIETVATREQLMNARELKIFIPNSIFNCDIFHICYFQMSIKKLNSPVGVYVELEASDKRVTKQMLDCLNKLAPGDIIYFDRITLRCMSATDRIIGGFAIEVVE